MNIEIDIMNPGRFSSQTGAQSFQFKLPQIALFIPIIFLCISVICLSSKNSQFKTFLPLSLIKNFQCRNLSNV